MNTFFEKIQRYDLLRAILFLIAGLIILIAPRSVFNTIVYLVAGYVACLGVINLYSSSVSYTHLTLPTNSRV